MKILIVSDTHRKNENLEIVLEQEKPIDLLIHLGDGEGCEDYIEVLAECPLEIVSGNNDFFTELPGEKMISIGKYKVLLTHGHYYYVNTGIVRLKEEALDRGVDIVMYGHTHRPMLVEEDGLIILNPGSLTYPRQEGRRPSYIIMEIEEDGEAYFSIEYL